MTEILAQHLGLHGGRVVNDDPAGVPLDEMVVGLIREHAGEVEEKLGDGTARGRLGLVLLQGRGGSCGGGGGFKGCAAHGCSCGQ